MENPAARDKLTQTIAEAIKEHQKAVNSGVIGGSMALSIATALRLAGLATEESFGVAFSDGWTSFNEVDHLFKPSDI